jgi:hypothetical protein
MTLLVAVALVCLSVIGCDKDETSSARSEKAAAEAREQAERQRRLDAERARADAEQHARAEQELRLAAEKQANDAATSKWVWIVVVALIGTVIGVAIRQKVTTDYVKQKGGG